MRRGCRVIVPCLLSAALAGGCGGDSESGAGGGGADCKDADKALTAAARGHAGNLEVAAAGREGDAQRISVDVCRTTDEDATAVVIVYGLRDDAIRDVRHRLRLIKVGGLWQVTDDLDSRRCRQGRGPQQFSGDVCR